MSYILDALKKLEQEKARKAKAPGSITIAGELFADERPVRYRSNGRTAALAILVAVALTFGITWYFLKGKGNSTLRSAPVATTPVAAPAVTVVAPPINQPVAPVSSAAIQPALQTVSPSLQQAPVVSSQAVAPKQPSVQAKAADQDDEQQPLRTIKKKIAAQPVASRAVRVSNSAKPVQQLAPVPADIQVSGVAWQDDRGLRRAVVNGLLMKEGASIAGAQLKEILPDRVRFERSGTLFEVPFVSSSVPAGK